jgi:PAS domain S-box-containing protein
VCEISLRFTNYSYVITFVDITERVKSQNSFVESLQNFKEISNNANDILWILDEKDDKILYSNKQFKELFPEIERKESNFTDLSILVYPDDKIGLYEAQDNYLKSGYISFNHSFRVKIQDDIRWLNVRKFPLHDDSGIVYRHVGLAKDITEQMLFVQKQQRNELFQKTIIELSNKFFNYPFSEDDGVNHILEEIGNYLGSLQVVLYAIDQKEELFTGVNAWTSSQGLHYEPLISLLQDVSKTEIEHLIPQVLQEDLLFIDNLEIIGFYTEIYERLQYLQVENLLILPVKEDSKLIGFLSILSQDKGKVYENDEVALLRLTKELIQNVKVRHLIESQLRTSEREYSTIFDNMLEGVVYLNKDAKILKANQRAFSILGIGDRNWTRWDEMNENVSFFDETLQPIEFDQLPISQSVKEGIEFKGKVVGLSFSETTDIRWLSISTKLEFLTNDHNEYRVFVTLSDISERKEFVDTLSESEHRYRRLTENLQDVVFRYELVPERKFSYISPSVITLTGYDPEEYYKNPDLGIEVVFEADRHLVKSLIDGNLDFESPVTLRWQRKDGRIIWVEQRNVAIRDAEGNLIAIEGIRRDVTQIKLMIDKLNYLNGLQELLMHIFLTFINVLLESVDEKIAQALYEIGNFTRAESLFVVSYNTEKGEYQKEFEWLSETHLESYFTLPNHGKTTEIQAFYDAHLMGKSYASEYDSIHIFTVPMYKDHNCMGFVGLKTHANTIRTKDFDNQILNLISEMLMNIKSRQLNLNIIKEGQLLLESIIENSGSVIYVKDLEGKYLNVNTSWEVLTGQKKTEVLGLNDFEIFPQELAESFRQSDKLVLEQQQSIRIEDILNLETSKKLFLTVKFPIRNAANQIIGIGGQSTEVTHLKLTEQALKESEANLIAILDSSPESIWSINKDFEIIYANQIVRQDFLNSFGGLLNKGAKVLDFLPQHLHDIWKERYEYVLQNRILHFRDTVPTEYNTFYLDVSMHPILISGEVVGVAVFSKNITKEKFAQNELFKFNYIFENLLNEIFIFDANTLKFIEANKAAQTNIGYTLNELRELSPIDLKPLFNQEQFHRLIEPLKNGAKNKLIFETVHQRKNATRYEVEVHLQYIELDGNSLFIAIIVDITERKKAEKALLESETRFRSIFQESASIMYLINPDNGQFIDANEACLQFYGWNREELLKRNILDINISEKDVARKFEIISRIGRQKFEVRHRKKHGEIFDMEVYSCKLSVNDQNLIFEIAHDITERNQYFRAVEIQNKSLKEIAWIQSHVVRAPLSRLMGLIMLLKEGVVSFEQQAECLEHILSSAFEIDQIIRDITQKTYDIKDLEKIISPNFNHISTNLYVSIVDDDEAIQFVHKLLLQKASISNFVNQFLTGKGIIDFISENNQRDDVHIIFLDLNMPEIDGWAVLDFISTHVLLCKVIVVIVSSSIEEMDKFRATSYTSVIDFIQKPLGIDDLLKLKSNAQLKNYLQE